MTIAIPGKPTLELTHLVLDMNGTLSLDGEIPGSVRERLVALAPLFKIHLLTADTFGTARREASDLPLSFVKVSQEGYLDKLVFVRELGRNQTVAIGNGFNDHLMLKEAALGIVVLGPEGTHPLALLNADIIASRIEDALDLLLHPKRITATLRT
ncbi:MAG: ATPase P [Calditrichaeota bacterium]|nr:ATPase P [Calditrichota bacterium]